MQQTWDDRPAWKRRRDGLSIALNTILNGAPDETTSSRTFRSTTLEEREGREVKRRWRAMRWIVETIFWPWDRGTHCEHAFLDGIARAGTRVVVAEAHMAQYKRANRRNA